MKAFVSAWWAVCVFAVLCLTVQDALAQTTVRPYKFGFTIDEQQHRAEKRDERGIVMGEFGFITADGIYHVTVYATDEEGKFRILAMRNYPYESPPKTIDMILVPQRKAPTTGSKPSTTTAPTTTKRTLPKFNYKNDACSGCSLPEKTPKPQILGQTQTAGTKSNPKTNIRTLSKIIPSNGSGTTFGATAGSSGSGIGGGATGNKFGSSATLTQTPFKTPSIAGGAPSNGFKKNTPGAQGTGAAAKASTDRTHGSLNKPTIQNQAGKVGVGGSTSGANIGSRIGNSGGNYATGNSGSNDAGGGSGANAGAAGKPFGGTNSNAAASAADGGGDLYRFKYTLDYNGHKETGSRNGNKQGNFFSVGDDNVERTIEYVANEFGFQPRIRWRKLEGSVPSKENTLKDYEFVWFKQP